jgi:ribosomal-protein-alanine N-acetyltransferase
VSGTVRLSSLGPALHRGFRIESGRICLRPLRQSDWRPWAALRESSREFLEPWEPTWSHDALGRSAFRRRVRAYDREWQQGTGYSLMLVRRDDDALVGGITLTNLRRGVAQCVSLGYWIGAPHARQGYMTEAMAGVLAFCFDDLGLHRVEAACLPSNAASKALLTRAGFQEEGYARAYLRINGNWQDHLLFAILREDWSLAKSPKGR